MGGGGGGGGMMGGGGGGPTPPSPSNTCLKDSFYRTNRIGEPLSMGANIVLGARCFDIPDTIIVKVGSQEVVIRKVASR